MNKGLITWMDAHQADIVCLQETKANPEQVDFGPFEAMGYHHYWHSAEKKGYSGVVTFCRQEPSRIKAGCGIPAYDSEGRILRTDFGDFTLLNCYFPSGTSGEERQAFKMQFLEDFYHWVQELRKERPHLIIVGDYNIAHREIDIHDPVGNKKSTGFLPEERAWLTQWFESGFTDAFRHLHPQTTAYSWWSFRANARTKNKGWRIDYQSVSNSLSGSLRAAGHIEEARHSDHCPLVVELDI
jgi:exodeoxyribonuclease-3